jgi:hypothetical protein
MYTEVHKRDLTGDSQASLVPKLADGEDDIELDELIPILLVRKQFTVSIKQLFGRLFEREQGEKKVPEAIQVTRT